MLTQEIIGLQIRAVKNLKIQKPVNVFENSTCQTKSPASAQQNWQHKNRYFLRFSKLETVNSGFSE